MTVDNNVTLLLAFNIALSLVAFLGGWLVKTLFERISRLEEVDEKLGEQIAKLREDLPDRYVRRTDFKESLDTIHTILRRVEEKLDEKVSKEDRQSERMDRMEQRSNLAPQTIVDRRVP